MAQVSVLAGFEVKIVRPSASFKTVVEPPSCCMWVWVSASKWQAEQTDMFAEVEMGLPGVVGFGSCVDSPVAWLVACTVLSFTG